MNPAWLTARGDAVQVSIRLQPRASRTEIVGPVGDALKVRVAAPPVEDAANEALLRFLARRTGLARSAIRLVRGRTARQKVVAFEGVAAAEVAARLERPGD